MKKLLKCSSLMTLIALPSIAQAAETVTFTYDAKGRVVNTVRTGGPLNGATTTVKYDKADNRTNVTVVNSPAGSGNGQGGGATVGTTIYVVVPLNGYTLIPIRQ